MPVFKVRCYLLRATLAVAGTVALTGCGGSPSGGSNPQGKSTLSASSPSLPFGNVQSGKSASLSDTLTNTGDSAVTVSAVTSSSAAFSTSGLNLPISLNPSQSVTFSVTFSPSKAGSASGTLAVTSNANNPTLNVALSGTGTSAGQLSAEPATLGFGNVVVGASSTLKGTLSASGSSVTIAAANVDNTEFSLSGISLPATLADGDTASFTVTFSPAATGTAQGALSFSSDAANSPTTETLSGKGINAPQHSVALRWDASTGPDVVGYNIYRSGVSGGPYSKINTALETGTAYTDSTVTAGQTYYFVTTAVDGNNNESAYSNQARAVIPTP